MPEDTDIFQPIVYPSRTDKEYIGPIYRNLSSAKAWVDGFFVGANDVVYASDGVWQDHKNNSILLLNSPARGDHNTIIGMVKRLKILD